MASIILIKYAIRVTLLNLYELPLMLMPIRLMMKENSGEWEDTILIMVGYIAILGNSRKIVVISTIRQKILVLICFFIIIWE